MGLFNKCKVCSKSSFLLKLNNEMCSNCYNIINELLSERIVLLENIKNLHINIEDNITNYKKILTSLSMYKNKGIELDFNPDDEQIDVSLKENEFKLAAKIQYHLNTISNNYSSESNIKQSIDILKHELLPELEKRGSKLEFINYNIDDINNSIERVEKKLQRKAVKEQKEIDDALNYIAFDIETTGLNADSCEIIEIAAVKINHGKIVDTFQELIKPTKSIPKKITTLTGITNDMVKESNSIEEILPKFIGFIEKMPLVAHNIEFDYSFIEANYKNIYGKSFRRKKVCTMKLYRKWYKEYWDEKAPSAKLSTCVDELLEQKDVIEHSKSAHRALNDAIMVHKIYEKIK